MMKKTISLSACTLAISAAVLLANIPPVKGAATPRAIFGENQMKYAACYKDLNPTFYQHSMAIMKANGASGWNIAGGPYAVTNHHVAGGIGNKKHNLVYNYESPTCEKETTAENTLTIQTEGVILSGNGGPTKDDWSVYKIDELAYNEAGIRQFFGTLALNTSSQGEPGTPVYVAHHPWGAYKRISSISDDGNACKILSGDNTARYYDCDTDGGSSGSPVLSQWDNTVLALHRGANPTANMGSASQYLYDNIKALLPTSNQADAATLGEGKVLVKNIAAYPYIPLEPIDLQVNRDVVLSALYDNRLTHHPAYSMFIAKGRQPGGEIVDVNVQMSIRTPCGLANLNGDNKCDITGKRSLEISIPANEYPTISGWIALHVDDLNGMRLRNLILPFNFKSYDPFISPFDGTASVAEYTLTDSSPLTTQAIQHTSNIGYVAVHGGQGPLTLTSGGSGYTLLTVQVKNQHGEVQRVYLRANRKTSCSPTLRPINSTTGCGSSAKAAALVISYDAADNLDLPQGSYTGLLPLLAKRDDFQQPVLIHLVLNKP